jgi:hypothetical protein
MIAKISEIAMSFLSVNSESSAMKFDIAVYIDLKDIYVANDSVSWNVRFSNPDTTVLSDDKIDSVNTSELNELEKLEYWEADEFFLNLEARFFVTLMHSRFNSLHVSEDQII